VIQALYHPYLQDAPSVSPLVTAMKQVDPAKMKSGFNMKIKGKEDVEKLILSSLVVPVLEEE